VVRGLLAPRWLLVHLLALAAVVVCFRLGWWQWDRSQEASGTLQNLGYALQWPLFGLFVPFMYWRMWKLDKERHASEAAQAVEAPAVEPMPKPRRSPTEWRTAAEADQVDDAMAEYNSYLAALSARDGE
jgi:DNA-binding transcriptional regulator of glucitol operon